MTHEQAVAAVKQIVENQFGKPVASTTVVRDELGATSLDMASLQIGFEDTFKLVFGTGAKPLPIDDAWLQAKTVADFADMVIKFQP